MRTSRSVSESGWTPPAHRRPSSVVRHVLDPDRAVVLAGAHDRRLVEVDAEEVDRSRDLREVAVLDEVERADALLVQVDHVRGVTAAQQRIQEPTVAVAVQAAPCLGLAVDVGQVQRDPNPSRIAPVTEGSDGPPVGEEHVVRSGQRRLPVAHARRFRAVGVPEESGHPGLVVGHPGRRRDRRGPRRRARRTRRTGRPPRAMPSHPGPAGAAAGPSGRWLPWARSRAPASPLRAGGRSRRPSGWRGRARRAGCGARRSRTGMPAGRASSSASRSSRQR